MVRIGEIKADLRQHYFRRKRSLDVPEKGWAGNQTAQKECCVGCVCRLLQM